LYTLNVRGAKGGFARFEAETTAHDERKRTDKKREWDGPQPSAEVGCSQGITDFFSSDRPVSVK
jgi:hypothetical protein